MKLFLHILLNRLLLADQRVSQLVNVTNPGPEQVDWLPPSYQNMTLSKNSEGFNHVRLCAKFYSNFHKAAKKLGHKHFIKIYKLLITQHAIYILQHIQIYIDLLPKP